MKINLDNQFSSFKMKETPEDIELCKINKEQFYSNSRDVDLDYETSDVEWVSNNNKFIKTELNENSFISREIRYNEDYFTQKNNKDDSVNVFKIYNSFVLKIIYQKLILSLLKMNVYYILMQKVMLAMLI